MIELLIDKDANGWQVGKNWLLRKNSVCNVNLSELKDYREFVTKCKDEFAFIYYEDDFLYAAVDCIRSTPLFYALCEGTFYLSDSIYKIVDRIKRYTINHRGVQEFREVGYVTSKETLLKDIYALLPGESITYDNEKKVYLLEEYFSYGKSKVNNSEEECLVSKMGQLHDEVFGDLIRNLDGRQVVVPLSGGYDSRLMLYMLCHLGYENILCFTYGKENNAESIVSKKIASMYNVQWEFVLYSKDKLDELIKSKEYQEYLLFSCNGVSVPHLQDFLAVKELREKGMIQDDAVFLPGHAYDFLAGTHITNRMLVNKEISSEIVVNEIIEKNYVHLKARTKGRRKWIEAELGNPTEYINNVGMYHYWEWKERQAKYIANSIRVYEFYGYSWKLPFWDKRLISFWDEISPELRKNRNLFFKYMDSINQNMHSSNDRKFKKLREMMPVRLRNFLYRIKDLKNDSLQFYCILNCREKVRYILGWSDFIEKISVDTLLTFEQRLSGIEDECLRKM